MKKIVCFHLYNDYSGSPKVLGTVLQRALDKGYNVDLITSRDGVLNELRCYSNLKMSTYAYRFSDHAAITMLRYSVVQLYTFLFSLRYLFNRDTVFYINTLLPIGPALVGKLMCKRVVYHYHENSAVKGCIYKLLCRCMEHIADDIICVSAYQRSFLKRRDRVHIIPPAVPETFVAKLTPDPESAFERRRVLMLSSLKRYKGIKEFILLAGQLPEYSFDMVISDTPDNIDKFISDLNVDIPSNLTIYPFNSDVAAFYNNASLVLNLSDKNFHIETFGLTAIEAMSAGLPVIVPKEGGIGELVEDGINGYKIDVQDLDEIKEHIKLILHDRNTYKRMGANSLAFAQRYRVDRMSDSALSLILNS